MSGRCLRNHSYKNLVGVFFFDRGITNMYILRVTCSPFKNTFRWLGLESDNPATHEQNVKYYRGRGTMILAWSKQSMQKWGYNLVVENVHT